MHWVYKKVIRPILFTQPSEPIHDRTLAALAWAGRSRFLCDACRSFFEAPPLPVRAFGLTFPNPVGLAAGMDKEAVAVPIWAALGFGFSELGGVTWYPQEGNRKPRVFRAIAEEAVVNRMGFNNPGAAVMAQTLRMWRDSGLWPAHPVGINLGKSKITPLGEAAEDYLNSFRRLRSLADFFVVNVSSPNTPNLRKLQDKAALDEILAALQEENKKSVAAPRSATSPPPPASGAPGPKPILVKVAPDLSFDALDEILSLTETRNLAGLVATNTSITRPPTQYPACKKAYDEPGGLSGKPLRERSTEVIRHLYRQSEGKVPIIGVGGIFTAEDAWEKITAGATLLQVYTGMIFEGPGIAWSLVKGLSDKIESLGITQIEDAIGMAAWK